MIIQMARIQRPQNVVTVRHLILLDYSLFCNVHFAFVFDLVLLSALVVVFVQWVFLYTVLKSQGAD